MQKSRNNNGSTNKKSIKKIIKKNSRIQRTAIQPKLVKAVLTGILVI